MYVFDMFGDWDERVTQKHKLTVILKFGESSRGCRERSVYVSRGHRKPLYRAKCHRSDFSLSCVAGTGLLTHERAIKGAYPTLPPSMWHAEHACKSRIGYRLGTNACAACCAIQAHMQGCIRDYDTSDASACVAGTHDTQHMHPAH
jgi:hypothetical protein